MSRGDCQGEINGRKRGSKYYTTAESCHSTVAQVLYDANFILLNLTPTALSGLCARQQKKWQPHVAVTGCQSR